MRLRILYICYEDISGYNGAIRHITGVVKGLARNGHRIDLCVPKLGRNPGGLNGGSRVRLRYVPTVPVRGVRPLTYLFLSMFYLPCLYLRLRPDIVYVRDIKFTVLPALLSKVFKTPCILEVNGLTDEAAKIRRMAGWTFAVLDFFHRWNLRNTDHIVTVTSGMKHEMACRYAVSPNKISIITNGVDLKRFRPINGAEARKRVGLSEAYNYIGFVGGLFPWHGLDHLVEASRHVLKEEPHARFVIVGSGLMEEQLKKMVAKRQLDQTFIFTGMVPFDAVPAYINSFDVCIVFFKRVRKDPGDPIKLYEYLACGRPVVASNVTGYGDVVESIGAGTSVNSEDPIATADAILKLLKNSSEAEIMAKKGFEKARACFGWEKKVEETECVMREVLRKSP